MIVSLVDGSMAKSEKLSKVELTSLPKFSLALSIPPLNHLKNSPSVGEQFWVVAQILRVFGSTPINYRKDETGRKIFYFDVKSPRNIVPFVSALIISFLWIKYFIELIFNVPVIDKSFRAGKENFLRFTSQWETQYQAEEHGLINLTHLTKIVFVLLPLIGILTIISSWECSPQISKFLNKWDDIDVEYRAIFGDYDVESGEPLTFVNLVQWRNWFLFLYVGVTSGVTCPLYVHYNVHYERKLELFFLTIFSVVFFAFPLLQDVQLLLTFKTISEAFRTTKIQISRRLNSPYGNLTVSEIGSWRQLICSIRSQSQFLGDFLKCHLLFYLAAKTVLITCLTFIILNGDYSNPDVARASMVCIGFLCMNFIQICVKTIFAEQITQREKDIAVELACVKSWVGADNSVILGEVKFLHDLILANPAKINLGNYVHLSKRLLLTISSQVVTYIIVLLQLTQK